MVRVNLKKTVSDLTKEAYDVECLYSGSIVMQMLVSLKTYL